MAQVGAAEQNAVLQLGRQVAEGGAPAPLAAGLAALQKAAAEDPAAQALCRVAESLVLDEAAALCVALWLYLDDEGQRLSPAGLLRQYRRLGGRKEARLAEWFFAAGNEATLHPVLLRFLHGQPPQMEGAALLAPPEGPPLQAGELFDELAGALERWAGHEDDCPLVLALEGEPGSGRRFLLRRLAAHMGWPVLAVEDAAALAEALLCAPLYGAALLLGDFAGWEEAAAAAAGRLGLALCCARPGHRACAPLQAGLLCRPMPALTAPQRAKALAALCQSISFEDPPDFEAATANLRIHMGGLVAAAGALRGEALAAPGGALPAEAFARVLRGCAAQPVSGTLPMKTGGRLEDVALPEEQKRQLADICGYAKSRATVFGPWGFGQKLSYGRGMSVLFYGAPGTGKTMAATVVAGQAGLPLYRVDLAQTISKYIGETQKNIGRVFDEAQGSDCILFFDEADALFSRRGEGGDAQDKYANAEVAYLLQRTEQHDGICILATNLLSNFDEAFRRRIGFMLHFPMPGAAQRLQIWRGIFPPAAPLGALDFDFLAEELELSGAAIKNCAVHAALQAAHAGTAIGMAQVLGAAANEYAKTGRALGLKASRWTATAQEGG